MQVWALGSPAPVSQHPLQQLREVPATGCPDLQS